MSNTTESDLHLEYLKSLVVRYQDEIKRKNERINQLNEQVKFLNKSLGQRERYERKVN